MALFIRPACLLTPGRVSKASAPSPSAMISRLSRPTSVVRRSFATDAKKPAAKPEAKPAPPTSKPADPFNAPLQSPTKGGHDIYKIAPDTPSDPNNPLHNQSQGKISQGMNETPQHVKNIAEAVLRLNMIEFAMLNKILDEKIGVPDEMFKSFLGSIGVPAGFSAAAASAAAASPAAGAAPGAPPPAAAAKKAEEKKKETFNLKLVKFDESAKIKILKEIRVLRPGMNLAETKALTDKLPSILKDNLPKEEAEKWVVKLKELGATVELE